MNLENKVVIITGSSSGIGFSLANSFLENGAKVVVTGINDAEKENVYNKLIEKYESSNLLSVKVNVTNTQDIKNMFEEAVTKFGKVDVLINNAGIAPAKAIEEMSDEDFTTCIDIDLTGAFRGTREAVKYMKETGGSIINTSSFVSIHGSTNQSAYVAAKAGLNGLTKASAKELGKYNIRVNAVAPGVIMTEMVENNVTEEMLKGMKMMTPLNRLAKPEDLVGIYLYLASDQSLHTTGTIINVDGGLII